MKGDASSELPTTKSPEPAGVKLVILPLAARRALMRHVSWAVQRLDPARYYQEPAYITALFARLDAVVYRAKGLTLEIKSTVVSDRGPNSAESIWGADFGVVASVISEEGNVEKAVLGQAKRGSLVTLAPGEAEGFRRQVIKMAEATHSTIGFEMPKEIGMSPMVRIVEVSQVYGPTWAAQPAFSPRTYNDKIFAKQIDDPPVLLGPALTLDQYLYAELIRCFHGDQDVRLLESLTHSSLPGLRVEARSFA
jgi:hypothetical protein